MPTMLFLLIRRRVILSQLASHVPVKHDMTAVKSKSFFKNTKFSGVEVRVSSTIRTFVKRDLPSTGTVCVIL